jgi:hypothetical protein
MPVRYTSDPKFELQLRAKSRVAIAMKLAMETIADSLELKCLNVKMTNATWGELVGVVDSTMPVIGEASTAPASASTSAAHVPLVVPPPAGAQLSDTSSSSENEHGPSSDEEEEKEFLWFRSQDKVHSGNHETAKCRIGKVISCGSTLSAARVQACSLEQAMLYNK